MGSTDEKAKLERMKGDAEESPLKEIKDSEKQGNQQRPSPKIDIVGAHARVRTTSDCSTGSPKSPSVTNGKKTRLESTSPVQNFIFPNVASSPPKFMSMDEVLKAANGVSNMILAHEIAVDKNFKLEKFEPPPNSIEKQVSDTMHKAFWDNLWEQLSQDPKVYTQAFVLLEEVKDNLLSHVILPHQTTLRQEITEKFDVELIKQQAEHNTLNFKEYSQYVLSLMARHCAPVRDEAIQSLMKLEDPVEVFKGVMKVLDLMRLDMANYTIQQIRPQVIAQSVEYERKKFAEFLETQNDGLELTRDWLTKHIKADDVTDFDESNPKKTITKIMGRAFLELLIWPADKLLPETIVLDGGRILELGDRLKQICMIGTILLVTLSSLGPKIKNPEDIKKKMKKNLCVILDPAATEEETLKLFDNAVEQAVKDASDYLKENDEPSLAASAWTALKAQLQEIRNPNQRVRHLMSVRAHEFIESLLNATASRPIQVPMGLSSLQEELAHVCGTFMRIVTHNRDVFGSYYVDIITSNIKSRSKKPCDLDLD